MIRVDRKLNSTDVLDALTDLFILRGPPEYIRSDNGPDFIAKKVRDWIAAVGAKTAYIEPFVGALIPRINSCSSAPLGEWILRKLQRPVPPLSADLRCKSPAGQWTSC